MLQCMVYYYYGMSLWHSVRDKQSNDKKYVKVTNNFLQCSAIDVQFKSKSIYL